MKDNKILIKDVLLIDGVKEEATSNVSILIEDKKITKIGKGIVSPEGVEVIAGEGKTAMPGMIDCHVHICLGGEPTFLNAPMVKEPLSMQVLRAVEHVSRYLPSGFTTICDLGSPEYLGVSMRNAIKQGIIKGPRVLAAGKMLSISGGHGQILPPWVSVGETFTEMVDGCDKVREAVRRQLGAGVDVIKFAATGGGIDLVSIPGGREFSDEEMEVIIKEANRVGKRTAAHAHGTAGIKAAIRAGASSIEHGMILDDEGADLMKEKGTFFVPTLAAVYWVVQRGVEGGIPEVAMEKSKSLYDSDKRSFNKVLKGGVKVAMGTDAGTPFNQHGANAFELELMVRNGMSEMDAIIATTKTASENLRISDEVGTIEEGKLADIIIIEGNPLNDIGLLQKEEKIRTVIKDGSIVVRKT